MVAQIELFCDRREGADTDTDTDAELAHADRLTVARTLYELIVAQHPGRLVMLCDQGCVLARSDRPETISA